MLQVVVFWASLISYAIQIFVKWTSLMSTWKGISFAALGTLLVTLLMHVLIVYSQAESSTTAKAALERQKKE